MGGKVTKHKRKERADADLEEVGTDATVRHSVLLRKATENDLASFGLSEEFANELIKQREMGKLEALSDVVVFLEGRSLMYEVQLEQGVLLRVDSSEQIVIQQREPAGEDKENVPTTAHDVPASSEDVIDESVPTPTEDKPTPAQDETTTPQTKIDVNSASAETLESLKGIGSVVAKRIIEHRETHGPFSRVEDLATVKGVSKSLLKKIQSQLTVENVSKEPDRGAEGESKKVGREGWRASFKWISAKAVKTKYNNRDVVRLASWNLQCLNSDKVANDGVREVVCKTIMENG